MFSWLFDFWSNFLDFLSIIMIVGGVAIFVVRKFFSYILPEPYKLMAFWVAAVLTLGGTYLQGKHSAMEDMKEINHTITRIVKQEKVITKEVVKWMVKEQKKEEQIHEKIKESITTKDDHMCVIPQSFIRVHDAAAKNVVPETGRSDDGSSPGATASPTK